MMVYLNISFIVLGYSISYLICKYLKPEIFIVIFLKDKKYLIKLHHFYFLILSLIAAIASLHYLTFTALGIGIHDFIIEIKKFLNNILKSKNS